MKQVQDALTKPQVSFFISVLSPVVAVAVTIAVMGNRIGALEERFDYFGGRYSEHVKESNGRFEESSKAFTEIQVRLAEIQKDILFIKERVN